MNRIVCLFVAFLALMLVSCSTYQTKHGIKKYEENTRDKKVYSIDYYIKEIRNERDRRK